LTLWQPDLRKITHLSDAPDVSVWVCFSAEALWAPGTRNAAFCAVDGVWVWKHGEDP
jgi:hypothetical protein